MCTRFLDEGEFCEKCADAVQSEAYVSKQSDTLNRPAQEAVRSEPDEPAAPAEKKRDKDRVILWLGFGGSSAMIFASLLVYSFPMLFQDSATIAAMEADQAREDCRLVFEEISYVLAGGGLPDQSMTCPGTNVPNIISRDGDTVIVSHPDPSAHGLAEMYVTNSSHEVFVVELGQS